MSCLRDLAREADAGVDVVGCVHVEHELDVGPDRLAHGACARDLVGERESTRLELHGAEALGDVACQLIGACQQRRALLVEPADGVGVHVGARAAQQAEHGLARRLARDVPQRNVYARHRRHELRPLVARERRRQAVPAAEPTRPRHRQREQLAPHGVDLERVQPQDHRRHVVEQLAHDRLRPGGDFADADDPGVRAHLDEGQLHSPRDLLRRPAHPLGRHAHGMHENGGDFHGSRLPSMRAPARKRSVDRSLTDLPAQGQMARRTMSRRRQPRTTVSPTSPGLAEAHGRAMPRCSGRRPGARRRSRPMSWREPRTAQCG